MTEQYTNMPHISKTQPKSGQFSAVWAYEGCIWSDTYKIEEDKMFCYSDAKDNWQLVESELEPGYMRDNANPIFITL